jgi:hypothetical protein
MTNEAIVVAAPLDQAHAGSLHTVVREPIPLGSLSLLLVPICVAVFVNCWVKAIRKKRITWQPTFLKIATLTMATAILVQIGTSLHDSFYDAAMSGTEFTNSAACLAMYRLALAHACTTFNIGLVAVTFCLALVIIANNMKDKKKKWPTSDDTERR